MGLVEPPYVPALVLECSHIQLFHRMWTSCLRHSRYSRYLRHLRQTTPAHTREPQAEEETSSEQATYEDGYYEELTGKNDFPKRAAVNIRFALGANVEQWRRHFARVLMKQYLI